jgi:hypothetical protein
MRGGRNGIDLTEKIYVLAEFSTSFGKLFDHLFRQWVFTLHDVARDGSFDACVSS